MLLSLKTSWTAIPIHAYSCCVFCKHPRSGHTTPMHQVSKCHVCLQLDLARSTTIASLVARTPEQLTQLLHLQGSCTDQQHSFSKGPCMTVHACSFAHVELCTWSMYQSCMDEQFQVETSLMHRYAYDVIGVSCQEELINMKAAGAQPFTRHLPVWCNCLSSKARSSKLSP